MRLKMVAILSILICFYAWIWWTGNSSEYFFKPKILYAGNVDSKIIFLATRKKTIFSSHELGLLNSEGIWGKTLVVSRDFISDAVIDQRNHRMIYITSKKDLMGTTIWVHDFNKNTSQKIAFWENYHIKLSGVDPYSGDILTIFNRIIDTNTFFVGRTFSRNETKGIKLAENLNKFSLSWKIDVQNKLNDAQWIGMDGYLATIYDYNKNQTKIFDNKGLIHVNTSGNMHLIRSNNPREVYLACWASKNIQVSKINLNNLNLLYSIPDNGITFIGIVGQNEKKIVTATEESFEKTNIHYYSIH